MNTYLKLKNGDVIPTSDTVTSIAMVEGQPVFPGDVLWYKSRDIGITVVDLNDLCSIRGTIVEKCIQYHKGEDFWAPTDYWTWTKPKQKKSGWINIYASTVCGGNIFTTKQKAEEGAGSGVKDTILITWEE